MTPSRMSWPELASRPRYDAAAMAQYLYPDGSSRVTFNRIKFRLRSLLYRNELTRIFQLFQEPGLRELPERYHELLDKPLRPYRFAGSSAAQRAEMLEEHYRLLLSLYPELIRSLYLEQGLDFGPLPEEQARIVLRYDGTFRREAELSFSILDEQDKRLYSCAFSLERVGDGIGLVIGSMQGPEPSIDDAQGRVRVLTKQAHGLRPKSLVVMLVLMLAERLGARRVRAVRTQAHVFQAKRYSSKQKANLQADYDELWEEFGATALDDNFVQLGQVERKPLEEIASKKRAMYRRRYEWLDALAQRMAELFPR